MNKFIALYLVFAMLFLILSSCVELKEPSSEELASAAESSAEESSLAPSTSGEEASDESSTAQTVSAEPSSEEISSEELSSEEISKEQTYSEEPSREESSEEQSNEESSASSDVKIFEQEGILIVGTRGMEQFFGSEDSALGYSKCVQNIKATLGDSVNVYSLVAPHASVYYAPKEGKYSNLLERGKIMHTFLKENAGDSVKYVDAYAALASHTDEYIYFRTEHHWSGLGAYYAAKEFAKVANVTFPDISTYEKHVKSGFVGTLYTFSGKAQVLKDNPDDVEYYVNKNVEYTAYYCNEGNYDFSNYDFARHSILFDLAAYEAFLGGDGYGIKIETNNNTGRTLVVLKDSYGNAVVPFLLSSFDTIYVLDYRYFKCNCCDFAKQVGATDVLVIASGFTACGSIWKKIEAMRTMN